MGPAQRARGAGAAAERPCPIDQSRPRHPRKPTTGALHVRLDGAPHVLTDEIGLRLLDPDDRPSRRDGGLLIRPAPGPGRRRRARRP
ncbi:hypothetical protein FL583_35210 [Cryptosporangium phraense]|uniref:Uncharacterized protein n=1 Tax=Cryptosporangium phraense TaxID=2593070 RepID=A0A545AGD1_9ACTN|nr:hypothetical protein FL583_35210 [Cryptosporangium phraense]